MKLLKSSFLLGLLCMGLASLAQANLSAPSTITNQEIGNQDPATVLAFFQDNFNMPDATTCFRGDANEETGNITGTFNLDGGGTITFTNTSGNAVSVAFDLTNTGHVICGFEVFGGGSANFYTVTADEGVVSDPNTLFIIHTPENKGGQLPNISHIQVFCCPGGAVPDSGTTAMLLGGALTGLALVRRYLKRGR
jgi:hypothetical protein